LIKLNHYPQSRWYNFGYDPHLLFCLINGCKLHFVRQSQSSFNSGITNGLIIFHKSLYCSSVPFSPFHTVFSFLAFYSFALLYSLYFSTFLLSSCLSKCLLLLPGTLTSLQLNLPAYGFPF